MIVTEESLQETGRVSNGRVGKEDWCGSRRESGQLGRNKGNGIRQSSSSKRRGGHISSMRSIDGIRLGRSGVIDNGTKCYGDWGKTIDNDQADDNAYTFP